MKFLLSLFCCCLFGVLNAQEEQEQTLSNIQTYTPSKLLSNGQWDIKWLNNLYTETKAIDHRGNSFKISHQNFFTSSLDLFRGVNNNNRLNLGLLLEYRSNTNQGKNILAPFYFGNRPYKRSGLSSIAPALKFVPFPQFERFAIQTAFSNPLFQNEVEDGLYLDQKGYTFQNRFFYNYLAPNDVVQIYTELNTELNFREDHASFANDSFLLTPGVFISYFPSPNTTILVLAQHSQLIAIENSLNQYFTALGGGAKFQLTKALNLELLYTNFIWGESTGLGQTFNLGVRGLFN